MKKSITILMILCLMASVFCVTSFAAETPAAGTVLRISAEMKKGGSPVVIDDYDNFQDGWNDAMEIAGDSDEMEDEGYARIVVDLYANWTADDGEFTDETWNGPGFDNDTIFITDGAKVTLNLNGHTIDRGLTDDENDGEVIFIDDDADVIINNGTITGGYSNSEGGCLYIESGANVTLNNVNLTGNAVKNDDGGAIYMYGGSTLTMNGGSISHNFMKGGSSDFFGTICVIDSTVVLKDVTIEDNYTYAYSARGLVLYAKNSTVKMENCTVSGNATKESAAKDIIYAKDSKLTITNTDFVGNNTLEPPQDVSDFLAYLFYLENSPLTMSVGEVTQNKGDFLFYFANSGADFTDVTITGNDSAVMDVNNGSEVINMTGCTLNANSAGIHYWAVNVKKAGELVMTDCDAGNTYFTNRYYVTTVVTTVPEEEEKIVVPPVSKEAALIGISGVLADGTIAFTEYYDNLPYAWNYAMDASLSGEYDRVVIDLYTDWTAGQNGEFAEAIWEGSGIYKSTLAIPQNAKITLNLNGHTISRGLTAEREYGTVLFIERSADVIINSGTITGSYSSNSGGAIHINGANVTLNNVSIYKNQTTGGCGAGIAVLDGATLTMNGGSFIENRLFNLGTLYVNNATATLDNVTISNNRSMSSSSHGVAVYADNNATVTVSNCFVSSNAIFPEESVSSKSIIGGKNSIVTIENTEFTDNASDHGQAGYSSLLRFENCVLTMEGGSIIGNRPRELFHLEKSEANIHDVVVTDNTSQTFYVKNNEKNIFKVVTASECTFNNNNPFKGYSEVYVAFAGTLALLDCDLGDTVFEQKERITFSDQPASDQAVASMFGGGSLSMIVSLFALISSGVAIFMIADMKKKLAPVLAKAAVEDEDEE